MSMIISLYDDRRHVRYYGGYHSQHKVIVWLWEVVKNDLNREEKAAFLKVHTCIYDSHIGT